MNPRVSIIVVAHNEGATIKQYLERLLEAVALANEVLVVYDSADDTTAPPLKEVAAGDPRVVPLVNTYGPGPARAIRFGFDHARAKVAVVTMADGCDDPMQIDQLARLVERGVVVAAASRYMRGGQQIGAPALKSALSRLAGQSLHLLTRVGTRDATNSFKAYSMDFVRRVGIESDHGFEIGIELVAKARRRRLPVAEIPTIWLERTEGQSSFKLLRWLPHYLRWYFHAFGPPPARSGADEMVRHPELRHCCTRQPETGQPETGQPETGQPETGQPETGQPETGQPATGGPEVMRPDAGAKAPERSHRPMERKTS